MNSRLWFQLNAVLGSLVVTIGLWLLEMSFHWLYLVGQYLPTWVGKFLVGAFPLALGLVLTIVLAIVLVWKCSSIGYIWSVSTFLLGLESLAWPVLQMVDIRKLGPEPPLEELQRIFTAVLFGLFSGVFWMTFAYGIYKRTRGANAPAAPSVATPQTKNQRKKARKKSV